MYMSFYFSPYMTYFRSLNVLIAHDIRNLEILDMTSFIKQCKHYSYGYFGWIKSFVIKYTVQNNKFDVGTEFILQQPKIILITEDIVKVSNDTF